MSSVGLALRDPASSPEVGGLGVLLDLQDLGAVHAWAVTAVQTAPGARAIHATTFAERLGALREITERLDAEGPPAVDAVQCLLYLVATDPLHACEAALLLPAPWWRITVEVLAHNGAWSGLWEYMHSLRRSEPAVMDEVFDHVETLIRTAPVASDAVRAGSPSPTMTTGAAPERPTSSASGSREEVRDGWARAWWRRRDLTGTDGTAGADGVESAGSARSIVVGLREQQMDLARSLSPSKASAYVRAHYTSTGSESADVQDNSWAGLIARIDDPRMLRVLFDQRADLGHDQHLGYPHRRACLANPVLPVDLADQQVVLSGSRPGPPRRQASHVVDVTCLDMAVEASRCASAEVVASVVWADPARWWREFLAPDQQPVRSRHTGPWPVYFADRSQEFHQALAVVIDRVVADTRAGRGDVGEVRVNGQQIVTRGQDVEQRLRWLLENASGPGFEAVLASTVAYPEIKVVRRAASHQQLPPTVAADLIAHPDRWVRAGAERAFSAALNLT